ncbi:MAG: CPXCG motif-containing cysteine-rich protein [Thermoanaerobaculia bacterium]
MVEDEDISLDEDFPLGDGVADMEAVVVCPYCGEEVEITLDPGGGSTQAYVEDCAVCCSPWMVHVHYSGGDVNVSVEQTNA